jgi:hypothetical protein
MFGYILRDLYPSEINQAAFPQVVEKVAQVRATQPVAPQGQMPPSEMPEGVPQGAPMPSAAPPATPDSAR